MISTEIRHWAESRETSYEIALAIHAIETPDRDAHLIWEDPSPEEMAAVKGQLEPGEYYWGSWTKICIQEKGEPNDQL